MRNPATSGPLAFPPADTATDAAADAVGNISPDIARQLPRAPYRRRLGSNWPDDGGVNQVLACFAATCAIILMLGLVAHALSFKGQSHNSYGILAQSLLQGRLDVGRCPEADCALFEGRTYIIFPPMPAVLALPFVAMFGSGFKFFGLLAIVLALVAICLWQRIFTALDVDQPRQAWLLAALAFASPVFGVTFGAGNVWFFAQLVGFFFMTAALYAVLCRDRLVLAAGLLGCAFLCRQMSLLCFPALLALAFPGQPTWRLPRWATLGRLSAAAALMAFFVVVYWLYNWARFGDILETGYRFIVPSDNILGRRLSGIGLFSPSYVFQNAIYLLVNGPHVAFSGPRFLNVQGLDSLGTSLLSASPWVVLAVYVKLDRTAALLFGVISLIAGITLFYHGNGFEQMNMQRFTLDWLPLLLVLMARSPRAAAYAGLPVLVSWGIALNLFAVVIVWLFGLSVPA